MRYFQTLPITDNHPKKPHRKTSSAVWSGMFANPIVFYSFVS